MEGQKLDTAIDLLLPSMLAAITVGEDLSRNATQAIHMSILRGEPVPSDYWPELRQCTDLLCELIDVLEGTS